MSECCKNCIYFHRLKHNFQVGTRFEESTCCDVWVQIEPTEDSWIQEVPAQGMCELYKERS